ncbi:MAG: hypothetical protein SWO11_20330 [Thermodesulfobacteriota bacterium]|nr:hypothetical protein [Thermodesulfobacteriota bacterium]
MTASLTLGGRTGTDRWFLKNLIYTLISGRLRVKDERSRIGIGFYFFKNGKFGEFRPQLWCEPKGTAYEIDYNPKTGKCVIDVT